MSFRKALIAGAIAAFAAFLATVAAIPAAATNGTIIVED
jgi:hypothetical protein